MVHQVRGGLRRAPHEGQKPWRLQLKATSLSWPQSPQRKRRKPWARMPHSRKASNSSLTNCGRSAPAAASVWAREMVCERPVLHFPLTATT